MHIETMLMPPFASTGAIVLSSKTSGARSIPAALAAAWLVAVLANAARLVVCVSVDAFVPEAQIPVVHMFLGVAVFLPVFAALWYTLVTRKELTHGKHAAD